MLIFASRALQPTIFQKPVLNRIQSIPLAIHNVFYATNPQTYKPKIAYIRQENEKDLVHITFEYSKETVRIKRLFAVQRLTTEPIEKSLEKMQSKVISYIQKKQHDRVAKAQRKSAADAQETVAKFSAFLNEFNICLVNRNGASVQGVDWQAFIDDAADATGNYMLKVGDEDYGLAVNYPLVSAGKLPSCIMVGYECYPLSLEFQFTTRDECEYRWFKGVMNPKRPKDMNGIKWMLCGESFHYDVQVDDIHHFLKVVTSSSLFL